MIALIITGLVQCSDHYCVQLYKSCILGGSSLSFFAGKAFVASMKSGFLNVAPSDSMALLSISEEKGSRNKRKFRADPPSPFPLPLPICNGCDRGRTAANGSESSNNWANSQSLEFLRNGVPSVAVSHKDDRTSASPACCVSNPSNLQHDRANAPRYIGPAQTRIPYSTVKVIDGNFDYQQISLTCQGTGTTEICEEEQEFQELQEPDWDNCSEAQLEEILISMLDLLYKDAIKKITSSGICENDALKAVLKNGRCYGGRDAVSSVVENALACIKNSERGTETRESAFTDLKQMEVYVLAEMVCVLRKVRPFLSRGDAMWCLLICDMNVAHACAMEDDAVPNLNRDSSPNLPSLLPKAGSSLSSASPNGITLSQQTPRLTTTVIQPSGSSVNSRIEGPAAFSAQSFSSSSIGTAASDKRSYPNTSSSAGLVQGSALLPSSKICHADHENHMKIVNFQNTNHLQLTTASVSGSQSIQLGSCGSECPDRFCSLYTSSVPTSDRLVFENSEKLSNQTAACSADIGPSPTLTSTSCFVAPLENASDEEFFSQSPTNDAALLPLDAGDCLSGCGLNSSSNVSFPIGIDDQVQTESQIGNLVEYSRSHESSREVRIDQSTADDSTSFTLAGTELSLGLDSGVEEGAVCNVGHSMPITQSFGWTEADGEKWKNEMLIQLVHRVKELEAQLHEWTDWAQQKVMQAARRLSKDSVELKALRLEREEYGRLKKEKQALEESTMKKLSEMENALRKASSQVDRANAAVRRLEVENAEVRAEMEAAKASAAESVTVCQEVTKREKMALKKAQGWEKQKAKLQEELAEERRKLVLLEQHVSQAKERQQQAEVRWRQEKKVKEEAQFLADSEKQAKEQAENNAKRREEALRRKADADCQHHRDDIQRLQNDIGRLRMSSQVPLLKWESGYGVPLYNLDTCSARSLKQMNARLLRERTDLHDLSQREIHRDRECVMCMSEEMSVVFLPCAHQVVCVKCNELHEKQGLRDCPSCRTPIHQRICVYGVSS